MNFHLAGFCDGERPHQSSRLTRRLEKAKHGLLGDTKPVGNGVHEMREFFGPGWRMYYIQHGATLVVMLGGGDKSTQPADIKKAIRLANSLQEPNHEQENCD